MEVDNSSNDDIVNVENEKLEEEVKQDENTVSTTVSISLSNEAIDQEEQVQEQVQEKVQEPIQEQKEQLEVTNNTTPEKPQIVQSSITLHHDAKLIQVCGEDPFHFIPVPLSYKSLNLEDAFIMQSDAYMFVWSNNNIDSKKKAKAIQMAQKLKAEIGCQRAVQVLEFGEEHPTFTFCLGLAKGTKLQVTKEKNDIFQVDEDGFALEPEFYLYKLATVEGKLNFIPIEEEEIKQEMFESNSCFILDCEHEIFIWQGKSSAKSERECCLPLAKKIQTSFDRSETFDTSTCITVVFDGSEGCIFKSKFKSGWKDKQVFSYLSGLNKKKSELTFDVQSMHTDKEIPVINLGSNDNKGKLLVWSCAARGNGKFIKVEEDDFGIFYNSKSYVCHFIYKPENKNSIKSVIFYWEGMYSNSRNYIAFKFGLYKEIQKKMQSLQSDDPIEYRISQNKEPKEFFQLFGTELLILNDEINVEQPKPMMLQVRGTKGCCRGTQLTEITSAKLNSMDSFVFIFPSKVTLVWYGKGSNEEERLLASELVTFLPSEYEGPTMEFEEGQESASFWKFIGGKLDYPTLVNNDENDDQVDENDDEKLDDNNNNSKFKPKIKLFLCTESTGIFKADEIKPFSQVDLNSEENVILDVNNHIFLWRGSKSTDSKFELTEKLVREYISTIPSDSGRVKDSIKYTILQDGQESDLFKSFFVSWKFVAPKEFIDPLLKQKENVKLENVQSTPTPTPTPTNQDTPQEKVEDIKPIEDVSVQEVTIVEKLQDIIVENGSEDVKLEVQIKIEEPIKVIEEYTQAQQVEEPIEQDNIDEQPLEEIKQVEVELEQPIKVIEENTCIQVESDKVEEQVKSTKTSKKEKKSTPSIQITPPITSLNSPVSVSTSGDLLFAYEPFHSPIGSPKQNRKGKKGGKNRNRNNNNNNNVQLSSSPKNRAIESLHLDSSSPITKKNNKFHNRTGSYNH